MNDQELRDKMSSASIKWARQFDINVRARNIVELMNTIEKNNKYK